MRRACLAAILLLSINAAASAVDLAKIERQIARLPELRSSKPAYCLLAFGANAATRVWLVRDGDVLYVDRNGNGDLTEPGERVEADPQTSQPADEILDFRAGDIPDGDAVHKDLRVAWFNVEHMKDIDADVNRRLARDPDFRGCSITIDVALAGYRGRGIDGRVAHAAGIDDYRGLLEFGPTPAEAPIIHFGGPWQVSLSGKLTCRAGRLSQVVLVMGTPGIGPGTTTMVGYEGVVPEGLKPKVTAEFPSKDGSTITEVYELARRCCYYNLYDDVRVPARAAAGIASWKITLDGWSTAKVASSTHEVTVLPAKPGPTLEPASSRLTSKLAHVHPGGAICAIQFSPDGRRLIAGDYPGGIVHVWDLTTGQRLMTVETDDGLRASTSYFAVTPDWQTMIAPTNTRGKFERFQRDGKTLGRVTYDGAIRVWDLDSGSLLHTWPHDPPRSIRWIKLSPDGRWFLSSEEVPGEFEQRRPMALSLWNAATGEHRQVAEGNAHVQAITPDGRLAAASVPRAGDAGFHESIRMYTIPEWKETARIALDDQQTAYAQAFTDDGQIVIGVVTSYEKLDHWRNFKSELKFWNAATAEQILSIPAAEPREIFMWAKTSPDGRTVVATTFQQDFNRGRVLLVDLQTHDVKALVFDTTRTPREPAFHPSGKWLAVPIQILPGKRLTREPQFDELPQPRIQLIEVATGKILEELVAPQSAQTSIAFSPDGKTLASSGAGEVLLWDFHSPPGQLGTPPEIGQPLEIEGTLVGGKPLAANAYRGKVTLVSYWATWCRPCVAELPDLKRVYAALHEKGFEVVGISLDDHTTKLDEFVANQGIPWAVVHGTSAEDSGMHHPMAVKYAVESVPKSFLLDQDGEIVAIDPYVRELPELVEKLLDQKAAN